ncbi:hypothetical protein SAMN05443574_103266 [Haloarcula vallismortis]|uniref:Uncharacterized protein n=2 Tax=Haloarcula vallismortis TaxID=28442 RepID=M0JRH8_HALVA|nr:hypothetical protein [Haloarcula vallismortis]EMA11561.1 hypothetical protein C437_01575 [Haloarcula vallismortis ATCC 29715]SDW44685.1 hypothetical protein SAMN05443574_103266 [Haloarcula vallismortis]
MSEEKITSGQWAEDVAEIHKVVTDNNDLLKELNELNYDPCDSINLSYFKKNNELNKSVISVAFLRKIVEYLEAAGQSAVMIEVGNDVPVLFSASENNTNTVAAIAPRIDHNDDPLDAQLELGPFETVCRNEDCNWTGKYDSENQAVEAGKEHRYFEGHQFKVYTPLGDLIHDSKKGTGEIARPPEEGDTQSR